MAWAWDPNAKRYRDMETGHFLSRTQALEYVERSLDTAGIAADQLAGYVARGMLDPKDFGKLLREEIKKEYIRQYEHGIGGRDQMRPSDWGRLGGLLNAQYHPHLDNFVKDLLTKDLTEDQIAMRARMYINSARQAYEAAREQNAQALGLTEILWVVSPAVENCQDCLDYQAKGWVKATEIKARPGDGSTQCKTNCHCHLLWRNPETGQNL